MRIPAIILILVISSTTSAQQLNPDYLSEFPTLERLGTEVRGADKLDTAAQQINALLLLKIIVIRRISARSNHQRTPDEDRLIKTYSQEMDRLYALPSTPLEKQRFSELQDFYLKEMTTDEMLLRLFSGDFRRIYWQENPTDPPEQTATTLQNIWKRILQAHDTYSGKDFFIYFAPYKRVTIWCRSTISTDPVTYTVDLQNQRLLVTLILGDKSWSLTRQADGSLKSIDIHTFSFKEGDSCSVDVLTPDARNPDKSKKLAAPSAAAPAVASPTPLSQPSASVRRQSGSSQTRRELSIQENNSQKLRS